MKRLSFQRWMISTILSAGFTVLHAIHSAGAEGRAALVVGIGDYKFATRLSNPSNDATDFAALLRALGFSVIFEKDQSKAGIIEAVQKFEAVASSADIALFYFSGHAIQSRGENYLIPADGRLRREEDLILETIPISNILQRLERDGRNSATLVFLDACRDNPFLSQMAPGQRAARMRGLVEMQAPKGSMISFATQPGNTASDGNGRNSPYTKALLKHISVTKQDLLTALAAVRRDVAQETSERQITWEHTSLRSAIYLAGGPNSIGLSYSPAARPRINYDKEQELIFWNSVKDTQRPEFFQAYLDRFPNGTFSRLAKLFIELFGSDSQPIGRHQSPRKPLPKSTPPASTLSGINTLAPVGNLQPDLNKRLQLIQELQRSTANIESDSAQTALNRAIQSELKRVGCYAGEIDGTLGSLSRKAIRNFVAKSMQDKIVTPADDVVLKHLIVERTMVCM